MNINYAAVNLQAKGTGQGTSPTGPGSSAKLTGTTVVNSVEKSVTVDLRVDSREGLDFLDPTKQYTLTIEEVA